MDPVIKKMGEQVLGTVGAVAGALLFTWIYIKFSGWLSRFVNHRFELTTDTAEVAFYLFIGFMASCFALIGLVGWYEETAKSLEREKRKAAKKEEKKEEKKKEAPVMPVVADKPRGGRIGFLEKQ